MKKIFCTLLTLVFTYGCTSLDSSPGSVLTAVRASEKISATGYAVIAVQPSDDPAQRRLLAIRASKLDAYRTLAEQVYGQYVDSQTTIGDLVLRNDSFRSKVEGVVYGAEIESIDPLGGDTYAVTLTLDKTIVRDLRVLYMRYAINNS